SDGPKTRSGWLTPRPIHNWAGVNALLSPHATQEEEKTEVQTEYEADHAHPATQQQPLFGHGRSNHAQNTAPANISRAASVHSLGDGGAAFLPCRNASAFIPGQASR